MTLLPVPTPSLRQFSPLYTSAPFVVTPRILAISERIQQTRPDSSTGSGFFPTLSQPSVRRRFDPSPNRSFCAANAAVRFFFCALRSSARFALRFASSAGSAMACGRRAPSGTAHSQTSIAERAEDIPAARASASAPGGAWPPSAGSGCAPASTPSCQSWPEATPAPRARASAARLYPEPKSQLFSRRARALADDERAYPSAGPARSDLPRFGKSGSPSG